MGLHICLLRLAFEKKACPSICMPPQYRHILELEAIFSEIRMEITGIKFYQVSQYGLFLSVENTNMLYQNGYKISNAS